MKEDQKPARVTYARAGGVLLLVSCQSCNAYLAIDAAAAAIFAFTASRLKLAPFCIGGNSIAVMASFSTCCWTNTKRQNSYLNQSKFCCAPYFAPLSAPPAPSPGPGRKSIRWGLPALVFSQGQPAG